MFQSIDLSDDREDADNDWEYVDHYDAPQTSATPSTDAAPANAPYGHGASDLDSDEEYAEQARSQVPRRKPGGYDSRIEQILYENPDMSIIITDAGKSLESGGRFIVYTIRTGVCSYMPLDARTAANGFYL
jgi:sorting nexin-41/42